MALTGHKHVYKLRPSGTQGPIMDNARFRLIIRRCNSIQVIHTCIMITDNVSANVVARETPF